MPLRRDFAQLISEWIQRRPPLDENSPLFPIRGKRTAEMLRRDLEREGIPYQDDSGRVVDFHALRKTFITNLSRSGVSPKLAQVRARHSDINLTMNAYTSIELDEQSRAVECLPPIQPPEQPGSRLSMLPATATGLGQRKSLYQILYLLLTYRVLTRRQMA